MRIFNEQFVSKQEQQLLDMGTSPEAAKALANSMREMLTIVDGYHHHKAGVLENADLSKEGKVRRVAEHREKARSQFQPLKSEAAKRVEAARAARDAAIKGLIRETGAGFEIVPPPTKERSVTDYLEEREIRDRLHGMPTAEVYTRYRDAIANGDHVFVRAVEGGPRAFRPVTDEQIKAAEEAKLEASPYAKRVRAYESQAQVLAQAIAQAERELD